MKKVLHLIIFLSYAFSLVAQINEGTLNLSKDEQKFILDNDRRQDQVSIEIPPELQDFFEEHGWRSGRIVGGEDANIEDYPWHVALMQGTTQFCAGSIIHEEWILTAAHCVLGSWTPQYIRAGVTNRTHTTGQDINVIQIIAHPDFDDPVKWANDIALLRLQTPLNLAPAGVAIVPVVTQADALAGFTNPGVMSTITGWGALSWGGPSSDILQAAQVPITDDTGGYNPSSITPDMLLAGYPEGGVDACQGDSGGPLVVPDGAGGYKLAGITSWGNGCAFPDFPGVYARVSYFEDWIKDYVPLVSELAPAAPTNLIVLAGSGLQANISWTNPDENVGGEPLTELDEIRLFRNGTLIHTVNNPVIGGPQSFTDNSIPSAGIYNYAVLGINSNGQGSPAMAVFSLGIVLNEPFDYPTGQLPPGWTRTGPAAHNWFVSNTSGAGGSPPELQLFWNPQATGLSRVVSYPIILSGEDELIFTFKQYLDNYSVNQGEIAAVDVSFDDGESWINIWEEVITADIPQGEYQLNIDVPAGATSMRLGFRFEGNSFNINHWYIDDLLLEGMPVIIEEPFNLKVITEGLEPDQALFSWNNIDEELFYEGFEGGSLPEGWSRIISNTNTSGPVPATWTVNDYISSDVQPFGNYHAGIWWDFDNQDEWLISPEILIGDDYELEFWAAVFLGSTNNDHYYVKLSTDGGVNWIVLWDASAQTGGWNYYDFPIILNLSAWAGQTVKLAFHAVDGPTNDGLWYIWFIDEISAGPEGDRQKLALNRFTRKSNEEYKNPAESFDHARDGTANSRAGFPKKERSFLGFNIYLNSELVDSEIDETEYLFEGLEGGNHIAGVQSVYTIGTSNIITIEFEVEGLPEIPYTVSGVVEGSDGVLIQNAEVSLEGIDSFSVLTDENGVFVFEEVFNGIYSLTITASEYEVYEEDNIVVEGENVNLGVIVLDKIAVLPTVTTAEPFNVTSASAASGGVVTDDGGAPVTSRGVVWSTLSNPTLEQNEGFTIDGQGTGVFTSQLTDLLPLTSYFVRAYATNSEGTSYGEQFGFTTLSQFISLDVKVILEGAFLPVEGNLMRTTLNPEIPLNQPYGPSLPYFGNNNPKWYYTGDESVDEMPANVVDWVLIELRDAAAPNQANAALAKQAALLLNTGHIVGTDGQPLVFEVEIEQGLYVVVYHRNHLAVMSSQALTEVDGVYTWDFTQAPGKAYVKEERAAYQGGHKPLPGGFFGMFGGDGDGDGQVLLQDLLNV
ncbi:MAG: hypothetical protein EA393_05015, partial [Bacteroidetes bacterium]